MEKRKLRKGFNKRAEKIENNNKLMNKFSFESFGGNRKNDFVGRVFDGGAPRDEATDKNLAFSWNGL